MEHLDDKNKIQEEEKAEIERIAFMEGYKYAIKVLQDGIIMEEKK